MSTFWRVRLTSLAWGFIVSYVFTGSLVTSVVMFSVMAGGNTLWMWLLMREPA